MKFLNKLPMLKSGIVTVLVLLLSACASLDWSVLRFPKVSRQTTVLGDRIVVLQREDYGPGKIFLHLHANETTALAAARLVARRHGGQVLTLKHQKTREINFYYLGQHCAFDPNRIYTAAGRRKTLQDYGCYRRVMQQLLAGFAQQILAMIPQGHLVAVHNNRDYSLRDYLPKHHLARDARAVAMNRHAYYRNFFLVTQRSDFERLKRLGFNVVLQARHVQDDGSLSVYYRKRSYINVEAGYRQLSAQIQMLEHA